MNVLISLGLLKKEGRLIVGERSLASGQQDLKEYNRLRNRLAIKELELEEKRDKLRETEEKCRGIEGLFLRNQHHHQHHSQAPAFIPFPFIGVLTSDSHWTTVLLPLHRYRRPSRKSSCASRNSCTPSETSTASEFCRNTSNDTFSDPKHRHLSIPTALMHPWQLLLHHSSPYRPARHSMPISRISPYIERVSSVISRSHISRLWLRSLSSFSLVSPHKFYFFM